jgi:ribosomal protein L11 methylase PrmA
MTNQEADLKRISASFRDPAGQVYIKDDKIFRSVQASAECDYRFLVDSGCAHELQQRGWLIESSILDDISFLPKAQMWLQHPRLFAISYPYEWPFALLQEAALLHLDVQLASLKYDIALCDASAYNITFRRGSPLFIDVLSFRRYRDGDYWLGNKQFCEQFLHPLLLSAYFGVDFHAWYRGALEGIPAADIEALSRWHHWLSPRMLAHILIPFRLQRRQSRLEMPQPKAMPPFPRSAYEALLKDLRRWVTGLRPRGAPTTWSDYSIKNTYMSAEVKHKKAAISLFVSQVSPGLLLDIGCNSGDYAAIALAAGAGEVVGFDFDRDALDIAVARRRKESLPMLPLYLDAANPSPSQGWAETEREGFGQRFKGDALLALAFIHHLVIGRNIPLSEVVEWLISLAPVGLIEFIPKSDPTIQRMLQFRQDIFSSYSEDAFRKLLESRSSIVSVERISETGRTLFRYVRVDE